MLMMYGAPIDVGREQEQGARRRGVAFAGASEIKTGCSKAAHSSAPVASRSDNKLGHGSTPVVPRDTNKPVEPPATDSQLSWNKSKFLHSQHPTRFNLQDIKSEIVKRAGPEKANQYFSHFKRFISCNLKKPELDKLVISTIGKRNVRLHNWLIQAVLSNAILGETPAALPSFPQDISKPVKGIRRKPLAHPISFSHDTIDQNPEATALSAGNGIRVNGEKSDLSGSNFNGARLAFQGRIHGEHFGAKSVYIPSPDLYRPLRECQSAEEPDPDLNNLSMPCIKRLRILPCSEEIAKEGRGNVKLYSGEHLETRDEEYGKLFLHKGRSVSAPLGLPFCPGSFGSAQRPRFIGLPSPLIETLLVWKEGNFLNENILPDVDAIKKRMDHIAAFDNLDGVTAECAEVLSLALDVFLKHLIKSTTDLKGIKSPQECLEATTEESGLPLQNEGVKDSSSPLKKLHQGLNGVLVNNTYQASGIPNNQKKMWNQYTKLTLQDFKVAMALNPRQLGEDWPLQLEKITFESFDQ